MVILTKELIFAGATKSITKHGQDTFSWKNKQKEFLCEGVTTTRSGWIDRMVGVEVTDKDFHQFILMNPKCVAYELAVEWAEESQSS
jgi:hypothetical protein